MGFDSLGANLYASPKPHSHLVSPTSFHQSECGESQSRKMTLSAKSNKGLRQSGENFLANKYDSEKLDFRSR